MKTGNSEEFTQKKTQVNLDKLASSKQNMDHSAG